jgi:Na+/proline symporter
MATFLSSATLLGVPSDIYSNGTQLLVINLSYGELGTSITQP